MCLGFALNQAPKLQGKTRPTRAQALKVLISSSSLSASACTSAWVGGLGDGPDPVLSQLSTSNTVLAGPPRKVPLPTLISVFSFQHFSFSVRSLNQSGELAAHFA